MSDNDKAKKNRERTIEIIKADKGNFINQFIPSLYANENRDKFKKQIDQQIELANAMNPKGIIAALNGMKERNMRLDVVAFAEVPVLFILGKHDDRIPLNQALAQAAAAQLSEIVILGKSGHMGWLEETKTTIAAIDGFISLCLKLA
jgi:pimeloyl-ACP methyl ester carboxylesterase